MNSSWLAILALFALSPLPGPPRSVSQRCVGFGNLWICWSSGGGFEEAPVHIFECHTHVGNETVVAAATLPPPAGPHRGWPLWAGAAALSAAEVGLAAGWYVWQYGRSPRLGELPDRSEVGAELHSGPDIVGRARRVSAGAKRLT